MNSKSPLRSIPNKKISTGDEVGGTVPEILACEDRWCGHTLPAKAILNT